MIKKLFYLCIFTFMTLIVCISIYIRKTAISLPSFQEIRQKINVESMDISSRVYDRNYKLIDNFSIRKRFLVNYDNLPKHLIEAIISAEDKKFFSHSGIHLLSILRAASINLMNGKITQGASTITQQVARSFFLSNEKTFSRKFREILLSLKLESMLSKKKILELYVNKIYFGNQSYGIEAAARSYFNKSASLCDIGESALLASLPKAPSYLAPNHHYKRSLKRQKFILKKMRENGHINDNELKYWLHHPPSVVKIKPKNRAGYFIDMVKNEIFNKFSLTDMSVKGFKIQTTLDLKLHERIKKEISRIPFLQKSDEDKQELEVASVSMLNKNGEIISIFGGHDYNATQYNRAVYTKREITSALSPFIYAFGIEKGLQLNTNLIILGHSSVENNETKKQTIFNNLLLINRDDFSPFLSYFGTYDLTKYLKRHGFDIKNSKDLLIRGKVRSSPLNLAENYSTIFNSGTYVESSTIQKIKALNDKTLYFRDKTISSKRMNPDNAYVIKFSLQKFIQTNFPNLVADFGENIQGFIDYDEKFHNSWFILNFSGITSVIWLGSEFGSAPIAKNESVLIDKLSMIAKIYLKNIKASSYYFKEQKEDKGKNISFGRFDTEVFGVRSLPVINL